MASEREGFATIDVCGHEVPLPAYWRIVGLHKEGNSNSEIIHTVVQTGGSQSINSISKVVHEIIDNQKRLTKVDELHPNPNRLSRSMAVKFTNNTKPKPPLSVRLEEAKHALKCAEELEDELAEEAITLMRTRRRFSKSIDDYEALKQAEAGLDRETKRMLQKRQAAEDEVEKARMQVRQLEKLAAVGG